MERKKIVPKAKFDANKQEELLRKLQQTDENTVNIQQVTAITVNENIEKPIAVIPQQIIETAVIEVEPEITPVKIQQITVTAVKDSKITEVSAEKSGKIQRITVDMPIELYDRMKDEVDDNGQTIKGFIVNLVKGHFKK